MWHVNVCTSLMSFLILYMCNVSCYLFVFRYLWWTVIRNLVTWTQKTLSLSAENTNLSTLRTQRGGSRFRFTSLHVVMIMWSWCCSRMNLSLHEMGVISVLGKGFSLFFAPFYIMMLFAWHILVKSFLLCFFFCSCSHSILWRGRREQCGCVGMEWYSHYMERSVMMETKWSQMNVWVGHVRQVLTTV